ncbi:hypothetical protein [Chryseobacterium sp. MMS23-Vi53]|uniref:hypothetical protein n=1 Tax=Chryseobacterium sp. MMS23-Vi53 TaxID=3386644 RepID=UPI0039E804C5
MKFKSLILLFSFILFCQNLFAQAEVKKADEVFKIYFDTFVKEDKNALKSLNDYIKPMKGDSFYKVEFPISESINSFLESFPERVVKANKNEIEEFVNAFYANFKNGKLTIKNIKTDSEGTKEIRYSVSFQIPAKISDFEFENPEKIKNEEFKRFLNQMSRDLRKTEKTITTEKNFMMYQIENNVKIFYYNLNPEDLKLELKSFYDKYLMNISK